jgi:hypothetical protein
MVQLMFTTPMPDPTGKHFIWFNPLGKQHAEIAMTGSTATRQKLEY